MWRYASTLMVCGAVISKTRVYPGFIKYQQPSLWKRLGQTRSKRDMRDNIASKVGEHSFESLRYSRSHLLEVYSRMIKDEKAAIEITAGLGLELEELMYLSGSTKASKKLQKIYDEAQELFREGSKEAEEVEFFKTPTSSDNKKQLISVNTVKPPENKDGKSPWKPDDFTSDNFTSDNCTSDSIKPDSLEPVKKNSLLRPDPLENKSFSGSEQIEGKNSTESSKQKIFAKDEPIIKKVPELKPANPEIEAGEVSKKTEPKSQKTLFDF
jgi:replication factor C large subunit